MVNGTLSKIIYIGAWACLALIIIGVFVVSAIRPDSGTPESILLILGTVLGLIGGAHIKPPVNTDGNGHRLDSDQMTTEGDEPHEVRK